jgi:hypothetical protein
MSADYQPYGVEWEAEMMKWRKRDIIGLLRQACTKEGTNLHANNKTIIPVCPHARLKWSVYDCTIKDSFVLDLMDCNGKGTYSIPGNNGFGYSHQCNKFPGKPAHVGKSVVRNKKW